MTIPNLALAVVMLLLAVLQGCTEFTTSPIKAIQHAEEGSLASDISVDGQLAVVSSVSNGVNVWALNADKPRYEWQYQGEDGDTVNLVTHVHIAADSSHVITADRETFALWNVASGEPVGLWRLDESTVRDVAVSNQGRTVLVARSNGKIMVFEPATGRRLEFFGHQEKINSIDISPNGQFALSGSNDYVAYLWSTQSGQIIHTFTHPQRVTKVALDDQGRYIFTADSTNNANIWSAQTGELISQLDIFVRQQIFTDAVFSANGRWLLTGSPTRRVNLWSVESGEELMEWRVTPNAKAALRTAVVNAVGFYNDTQVVSESSSGLAEFWELPNVD